MFLYVFVHIFQQPSGKLCLLQIDFPILGVGRIILSIIVADSYLIPVQLIQVLHVIGIQRSIAAIYVQIALQQRSVDFPCGAAWRTVHKGAHDFPNNRMYTGRCPVNDEGGYVTSYFQSLLSAETSLRNITSGAARHTSFEKVTKGRKIEVRVSKSSASAPFEKLEFVYSSSGC